MDPAMVSAMAAVLGSLVGGATAWLKQRTLSKRELLGAQIRTRDALYGEFICACSKLVIDSFERGLDKPDTLVPAHELLNRIRFAHRTRFLQRIRDNPSHPTSRRRNPDAASIRCGRCRSAQVLSEGVPHRV